MRMMVDRRLLALASAHIVLGIVAASLASIQLRNPFGLAHILIVPLCALTLCQALLLALWSTYSASSPWMRLGVLVAGAAYLEALIPSGLRREFLGTSTIAIAVTTATLLVVRALGVGLTRRDDADQPARAKVEGLRFSIRGLMVFTAAVALLSAGARALEDTSNRRLLLIILWALCFVTVGLVALWAELGDARPLGREPVVFTLSPVLGVLVALAANAHEAGWTYITLIMLLYPALLVGSLLVLRSCSYRLIRREVPSPVSPSDGE